MAYKNYIVNDKWLDLNKQNIIELQSEDGELVSAKCNGEDIGSGGGGGGGDFSTAEVTITDESEAVSIWGAFLIIDNEEEPHNATTSFYGRFTSNKIVLYKGAAVVTLEGIPGGYSINTSGSIEDLGSGYDFVVTGDCTITVSR
jgi:hypothetical protein